MNIEMFLNQLENQPETVTFANTMAVVDANYLFTPGAFRNGELANAAGQNSGSCKLFSFAKLHQLTEQQTLQCFGDYYRVDVLQNPQASDHQNIRNFMRFGWDGIEFETQVLTPI